ncbi:MAG: hypothetical protein E6I75_09460 [Chloroflexi bacterium]|nr:MAG: hypothetical protein E6I75_09460 [Chloroflexota bacterium]
MVLIVFHLRLLEALGYRPELRECVNCRATIEPNRNHFSALLGGVLCPACGPREPTARDIGTSALKLLRFVQQARGQRAVSVPPEVGREAEALLRGGRPINWVARFALARFALDFSVNAQRATRNA